MKEKLPAEFCTSCGKEVPYRKPSQRKKYPHPFCSRECHMRHLNGELNPIRMTAETRAKIRHARLNSGAGVTYTKQYGRHEHRVIAEQILGRPLRAGEVVHHVDGNKRNNDPGNLIVFDSQSEHMRWHAVHDPKFRRGGDAL